MATQVFYRGQLIETLSHDELLDAYRKLSMYALCPSDATGIVQMTEAEAINLGLITPTTLDKQR